MRKLSSSALVSHSGDKSHSKNRKSRPLRLAGLPVAFAFALLIAFALVGPAGARPAKATAAPANTSAPTIAGTVAEHQTLTADKGAWTGTEPITYTYAWQSCDSSGGHCATIKNATTTTYTVKKGDLKNTLRVVVTAKNAEGTISATSAATAMAATPAPPANTAKPANTSAPTISGAAQEGQTLTAGNGTWTGTAPIAYSYDWQRCNSGGGHCANIGGANKSTYKVQKQDVNQTLRVSVSAKNAAGTSSASSGATALVTVAGSVVVTPKSSITINASTFKVVYGGTMTLSGTISTKLAGQNVNVRSQRYAFPDAKFASLATVTTGTGGAWSYVARPTIRTAYQADWKGATSPTLTIGVHPLVAFHVITGNRFSTKVAAARSFAGRFVQLQRRSSTGQWVTLKKLRLNANSVAIFRAALPKGNSTLRMAFSVNQAGAGYLGGMSRTIVVHRG